MADRMGGRPDGLLTTEELCGMLGCTSRSVYRWRKEGRISGVKVGNRLYFTPEEAARCGARFEARWYATGDSIADREGPAGGWWTASDVAEFDRARVTVRELEAATDATRGRYEAARGAGYEERAASLEAMCDAQAAEIEALLDLGWLRLKRSVGRRMDAGEWAAAGSIALDALEGGRYEGEAAEWLEAALRCANANGGGAS